MVTPATKHGDVSLAFVCVDQRLLSIANAEGLLTDDPTLHPSFSVGHLAPKGFASAPMGTIIRLDLLAERATIPSSTGYGAAW